MFSVNFFHIYSLHITINDRSDVTHTESQT